MKITHLQSDTQLIENLCNGYLQDSYFSGITLPAGIMHDPNARLYWLTDKMYVPDVMYLCLKNIDSLRNCTTRLVTQITNEIFSAFIRTFN
jgi:hypothetical protein